MEKMTAAVAFALIAKTEFDTERVGWQEGPDEIYFTAAAAGYGISILDNVATIYKLGCKSDPQKFVLFSK